ncbi:carboxylesterase type B [Sporothrix schenckii 1099-18]|uniref:Carboxylic ester hydrolase n=1 Tax=Sporothrix schenckii 1099-18 TaxID=1397361 RepID=A0A0F2MFD5_SPOSC|nr:carboxylesterase type B [Sporothrix schenckii 1099-18]KJR87540.1 carboxylesterase type B [Sporothrix schenckii 1099-18]
MVLRIGSFIAIAAVAHAVTATPITVDLGYASYSGVHNATTGLNVWKGIRYAYPPVGRLRWQAPQSIESSNSPSRNASQTPVLADRFGPACPQSLSQYPRTTPEFTPGNEDCLFLNVYAPANTNGSLLPVLVWIHGGGYGQGDGTQDMSGLLTATAHAHPIVAVSIQYRLGAFGFLASKEIRRRGQLNAGLLDQRVALEWVQRHIAAFGGDKAKVTLSGESAGAGSVLLHTVAANGAGGADAQPLFQNIWTASSWIPTQPRFDSAVPERHYADFVSAAGCNASADAFACLVAQDSLTLQKASNLVSSTPPTPIGNWAFVPVTDGQLLTAPPSALLLGGAGAGAGANESRTQLHGVNAFVGNNADEGVLLVPSNLHTEADLRTWLQAYLQELGPDDIDTILAKYAPANGGTSVATSVQQRAYNLYAEVAVVCPSYWLSTAFSNNSTTTSRSSYHYQYSVPFAAHGADLAAYWGPATPNLGPEFVQAFRESIVAFVATGNPSIPLAVANGASSANKTAPNAAAHWPSWAAPHGGHTLVNLNQTTSSSLAPVNQFSAEDADAWEGGRGERCAFWQQLGAKIPE